MTVSRKSGLSSHYYQSWWLRVLKFGLIKRRTPQEMKDKLMQSLEEYKNSPREMDEDIEKYLDEARHNAYQEWKLKNNK